MIALWWWIDRWRKSTAYTDLTLEEQGAYRNLLDEATLRGGAIPNDERILAKACGDALSWKRIRVRVLERFALTPDNFWRNETLDGVLAESRKRSEKQRKYRQSKSNDDSNGDSNGVGNKPQPPDPISGSVSDLPSPGPVSVRAREPVALAGTLPRDHIRHAWCSSRGKCVPDFLHQQFVASVGGEPRQADQRLKAFYEARQHGWPEGPIGDDPVHLWRREFAASFPSVAPAKATRDGALSRITESALRAVKEAQ